MLTVLKPYPVPDYFSLHEALIWVAFGIYPVDQDIYGTRSLVASMFDNPRNEEPISPYYLEDAALNNRPEIREMVAQLPASLYEDSDYGLNSPLENEAMADAWLKKRQFDLGAYEAVVDSYYSTWQANLFLSLKTGKLKAYGRLKGVLFEGVTPNDWKVAQLWNETQLDDPSHEDLADIAIGNINPKLQLITKNFWAQEGIKWAENSAQSSLGWYDCIFIAANDLYSQYPPPESNTLEVETRGNAFVIDEDNLHKLSKLKNKNKGRPTSANWQHVYAEATLWISKNGFPENQKQLVQHIISIWEKNGVKLADSTVYTHLQPLFEKLNLTKKAKA